MSSPASHAAGAAAGFAGMTELPPLPSSSSLSVPAAAPASTLSSSPLLLFGKYSLLRKLGSGSFGDIYLGLNTQTGGHVAVKLEAQDMRWKQLCFEWRLYSYLQGKQGIPKVYEFGDYYPYYVLVMELLGPSLEDLFNLCNRRFSVRCVCLVADQLLQRIELFHSKSFLHRDIKPDNFLVGADPLDSTIYMIDYGLAKKYRDMRTHQHFPYQENRDLTGTVRYTSINAHLGIEQSRRDDLESLGYVMLYFLRGSLPWQGMKASGKRDKYQKISVCKMSTSNEQLCAGQPDEFVLYLNYTRALQFDSKPDYAYLRGLFKDLLARKGWQQHDGKYDWSNSGKRTMATMAGLDVPAVPRPLPTATEMSQMAAGASQSDTRQQQQQQQPRQQAHSHNQSSPASAASPQQPLSASPPLSLSQQRASIYGTDTTHPSPRGSSPRQLSQLSPFYAAQQQQQQQHHQQQQPQQHQPHPQSQLQHHHQQQQQLHQQRLLHPSQPHTNGSTSNHGGVEPGRLSSQYDLPTNFSPGMAGQSGMYQLSSLPASSSPLLHHVPALSFSHPASLSSMNPGGGFKSLPSAFPPLLLSPLSNPQPFAGMAGLPFMPSSLSLPAHSALHAPFTASPYGPSPLSPSTFAGHPFFAQTASPTSTTAATLGDGASRLSSAMPHSIASASGSSSPLHSLPPTSLHHHPYYQQQQQHSGHLGLSPSSYSNTQSRSSLSSPLASPHFSSSASPYLTSASSTLSLSASPLHAANHAQLSTPPAGRIQPLTPAAHFG